MAEALKFKGLCESIQILQKSEITKRFATFFILSPIFLAKSKYSSYLCKKNLWKEDYSQKAILKT